MNKSPLLLMLLAGSASAQLNFEQGDWQVICDNTHHCRAAGYQREADDGLPVSLLLSRAAGDAAVSGKIAFQSADEKPLPAEISFQLDGKDLGRLRPGRENQADLDPAQLEALLAALQTEKAQIQLAGGGQKWELSPVGAPAALGKMDEAQGRSGTASALLVQGRGNGPLGVKAEPTPVIRAVKVAAATPTPIAPGTADYERLRNLLSDPERCFNLSPEAGDNPDAYSAEDKVLQAWPLDENHQLVGGLCWRGAYNETWSFGVFDRSLQNMQQRLGSDEEPVDHYSAGVISGRSKYRGVGDCEHGVNYVWTGEKFSKTSAWDSGLCRGFPGGAWQLPIFVSEVKDAD